MRLLLDMDGPLADFDKRGWEIIAKQGIPTDQGVYGQTSRYFTDHIVNVNHRVWMRERIAQSGWFADLPVTEGSQEGVEELLSHGIDLWVVTKPMEGNPTCRDDKGRWLRKHFPYLEKRMVIAPDKSIVAGDILLDDAPDPAWFERATWDPVIFSAPFNGVGSKWESFSQWTWGQPVEWLVNSWRPMDCGSPS